MHHKLIDSKPDQKSWHPNSIPENEMKLIKSVCEEIRNHRSPFIIGMSYMKGIIEEKRHFVDNTLLIKEIIDTPQIKIFHVPENTSKTTNLTMLQSFFDSEAKSENLFHDKSIFKAGELYRQEQGKYIVLYLNFRKTSYYENSFYQAVVESIHYEISQVYKKYKKHIFETILKDNPLKQAEYNNIILREVGEKLLLSSLRQLTEYLHLAYQKPLVVLINDYNLDIFNKDKIDKDTLKFKSTLLSTLLKNNNHIKHAVLMSSKQIPKNIMFPGLDNVVEYSGLDNPCLPYFSISETQLKKLLLEKAPEAMKKLGKSEEFFYKTLNYYRGIYQTASERYFQIFSLARFWIENSFKINYAPYETLREYQKSLEEENNDALQPLLKDQWIAFLMGFHPRLGANSSLKFFKHHTLFDKNVLLIISLMLFKQEKNQRVTLCL